MQPARGDAEAHSADTDEAYNGGMKENAVLTAAVFDQATEWVLPDRLLDRLRELCAPVEVRRANGREELLEMLGDTDYLAGFPITDEEFAQHGANLCWIQLTTAMAAMVYAMPGVMASSVRITTAAAILAPQRAEHALMLTLALLRRLPQCLAAQAERLWSGREVSQGIVDLEGQTVGIVGLDSLGRAIAQRFKAFGVELLACAGDGGDSSAAVDELLPADRLDELMARSSIIIVAAPHIPSAEGLLDRAMLANVGKGAILINVGRSRVCDEEALISALDRGDLAGAGLDVFETTPLPNSSPLWHMPNVIVTPRISGASPRYWERAVDVIAENLERLREGRPLRDELVRAGTA